MKRRTFLAGLGSTGCAWPSVLAAQVPSKHPLIGYLAIASAEASARMIRALLQGFHELDYQEGRNFEIAFRFADGDEAKLPSLTEDLLRMQPDVIYAINATPAKLATATIPIVSPVLNNPVRLGLIASYARPGGNVTGIMSSVDKQGDRSGRAAPTSRPRRRGHRMNRRAFIAGLGSA